MSLVWFGLVDVAPVRVCVCKVGTGSISLRVWIDRGVNRVVGNVFECAIVGVSDGEAFLTRNAYIFLLLRFVGMGDVFIVRFWLRE